MTKAERLRLLTQLYDISLAQAKYIYAIGPLDLVDVNIAVPQEPTEEQLREIGFFQDHDPWFDDDDDFEDELFEDEYDLENSDQNLIIIGDQKYDVLYLDSAVLSEELMGKLRQLQSDQAKELLEETTSVSGYFDAIEAVGSRYIKDISRWSDAEHCQGTALTSESKVTLRTFAQLVDDVKDFVDTRLHLLPSCASLDEENQAYSKVYEDLFKVCLNVLTRLDGENEMDIADRSEIERFLGVVMFLRTYHVI